MEQDFFKLIQQQKEQTELAELISCNEKTERFGLSISEEEARELMICRNESLKKYERVEFGGGILEQLIFVFCDSQYIWQDNYIDMMKRLQDIFYEFKNESGELLTDDELITFMAEQFEGVCCGDPDYLEDTCLKRFAAAIRAGYEGYKATGGRGEYTRLDETVRWDREMYLETLKELFW